jgi:hypothetical protein
VYKRQPPEGGGVVGAGGVPPVVGAGGGELGGATSPWAHARPSNILTHRNERARFCMVFDSRSEAVKGGLPLLYEVGQLL